MNLSNILQRIDYTQIPQDITVENLKHSIASLPSGCDSLFVSWLTQNKIFNKANSKFNLGSENITDNTSQTLPQKIMVIANNALDAKRLYNEIFGFCPQLNIAIYQDTEILPYERTSPPHNIIAERLKVLWLLKHNIIDVIIIQAQLLANFVPPLHYLNKILLFKVGHKISLTAIREQLIESDYSCVKQVFDAGEFAIRGSILDIIPAGSKELIRIEFFDDEIESINIVDKNTYSILDKLSEIEIIPTREYPLDKNSLNRFSTQMMDCFPNQIESNYMRDIKNGTLPPGSEFYLPLFFETACLNLLDLLSANVWGIVYYKQLNHLLEQNQRDINRRYATYKYQYPCLSPSQLFWDNHSIQDKLTQFRRFGIGCSTNTNYANIHPTPNVSILNNQLDPFQNLRKLITSNSVSKSNGYKQDTLSQSANKILVLTTQSLGRLAIMRNTLVKHNFNPIILNDLAQLNTYLENYNHDGLTSTTQNAPLPNLHQSKKDLVPITQNSLYLLKTNLQQGFNIADIFFICENDLYRLIDTDNNQQQFLQNKHSKYNTINRTQKHTDYSNDNIIRNIAELEINDYIVHINYGIGKYLGLTIQHIDGVDYEMLELEYQGGSKLFIPIQNIHLISHYTNLGKQNTELNKLGSTTWSKLKAKTEQQIFDIVADLLNLYAKRKLATGFTYTIPKEYTAFVAGFGYTPTIDQEQCFNAIINDMCSSHNMDRLVCGDVGFGKTEIAIRAAFIAAMNGKQVAVLSPTTLLTEQHYQNFINRFVDYPINIAEISRFKSKKEITQTLELLKLGKIDIIIGTHRLIQNDISFKNLGLVIIDEEHRFGVTQKEKLKQLCANVDFLAMTATPIPRSLSMALDGIRDFSIIATPPQKRLPVKTICCNFDKEILLEAINRELRRGGQIFFLYNDVASINHMGFDLQQMIPEVQIAIAHGQMKESVLEQTIRDFINQKYHLLLCSTIIENGIDIPNANTIFIYNAHQLGLAQLHQLRGRVGRSHHQAYCYLILPENLTLAAGLRIDAITNTQELGSGFNLAVHDLEIRGAGEVLGSKQSGNIRHVGLSLYTELLNKAVKDIKKSSTNGKVSNINAKQEFHADIDNIHTEVNLFATAILPEDYCQDVHRRLIFYKQLAQCNLSEEVDNVYQEIIDWCGLPVPEATNLAESHYIRVKAQKLGIARLETHSKNINLIFVDNPPLSPHNIISTMQTLKTCKITSGGSRLIWNIESTDTINKIRHTHYLLDLLGKE